MSSSLLRHPGRSPLLKSAFPGLTRLAASLLNNAPRPALDNLVDLTLLAHQRSEPLRSRLTREESPGVWVKSLVNHPLPISLVFHLSQGRLGILWVGACCYESAVKEHIASSLPRWEQHLLLEVSARLRADLSREGRGRSVRRRRRVKTGFGRGDQRVEILAYCIIDGRAG